MTISYVLNYYPQKYAVEAYTGTILNFFRKINSHNLNLGHMDKV